MGLEKEEGSLWLRSSVWPSEGSHGCHEMGKAGVRRYPLLLWKSYLRLPWPLKATEVGFPWPHIATKEESDFLQVVFCGNKAGGRTQAIFLIYPLCKTPAKNLQEAKLLRVSSNQKVKNREGCGRKQNPPQQNEKFSSSSSCLRIIVIYIYEEWNDR